MIRHYATLITRHGASPVAKLALLQTYLRTDHFTSSPDSFGGQSYARVAAFLDRRRTGTSEQFATAFALMARALGYPTRVAVGFRRGVAHDGRFSVTSAGRLRLARGALRQPGLGAVRPHPGPDRGRPLPERPPRP